MHHVQTQTVIIHLAISGTAGKTWKELMTRVRMFQPDTNGQKHRMQPDA